MFEVYPNLFIGTESECCFTHSEEWAIIHACKSPCHQRAVGYRGNLPSTHPNYLVYEVRNHLFLNMIDPPAPLFKPPLFLASLDFIEKHISERKVLIHCNLGLSRAPSIALLYLAKRAKAINGESYVEAAKDFVQIFPLYKPSRGIALYLSINWSKFQ
jgi:hypothetical protein